MTPRTQEPRDDCTAVLGPGDIGDAHDGLAALDRHRVGQLEVVRTDTDHLLEMANEFRTVEGVTGIEVTVILKYVKIEQMSLRGLL